MTGINSSLSKCCKEISKHYKALSVIGIIVFIPDLIKLIIKGIENIDRLDFIVDIIIYITLLIAVAVIRKKYKD